MNWQNIIKEESQKEYYHKIKSNVTNGCFPSKNNIYRALKMTPFDDVKVVILGQDPYHGGQANGLCFAVNEDCDIPPSLVNIFNEIQSEYGATPKSRSLEGWAKQGVLLLNTILTVEKQKPLSHKHLGWQTLTDRLISEMNSDTNPKVFMLWGKSAQEKQDLIYNESHLILKTTHPSPFSAHLGFSGCGHFKKANQFLQANNRQTIDWIAS